jgi:hypothetical protein
MMTRIVIALALTAGLASAANAAAKAPSSYEAKVSAKLQQAGYKVSAKQVTIRGMGLRMPGQPNSGKTKAWFVNTKTVKLSGRIVFDSKDRAKVTIFNSTKHAL